VRLRSLELAAFGPFTDVRLDLGSGGPELHLIYGRNEAGKSTTLRAVTDLLYGIPATTRDHHLHDMPKMRIGAVIEGSDSGVLEVRRRKGRKNTLLAPDDRTAIDEAQLRALLRGVSREMFETVFGLSHETLRSGANALLEGRGDVGESLFDAGIGGRGIHQVLERLESEAEGLWAPRASTRTLNQELRAYKDALKQIKHDALSSASVRDQEQRLEDARREQEEREATRDRLMGEQIRLERYRVVIPELSRLDKHVADREALGEVPAMAEDFVARRVEAQRSLDRAAQATANLSDAIDRLEGKRGRLEISEALAELDDDVVEELYDRNATQRKAELDLERRRAELRAAEDDARDILRRMGREADLEQARSFQVSTDLTTRIRTLAERRSGLEEALRGARDALEAKALRLAELEEELGGLGREADPSALERAVRDARRVGDLDERLEQATQRARSAARSAETMVADLGPWRGTVDEARQLPVPPGETVDRFEEEERALEAAEASIQERLRDLQARERDCRRERDAIEGAGSVPTEAQLDETRSRRDALWARVREGEDAAGPTGDELDGAMHEADATADRLRREAERVARHAALTAELSALERALEDVAREQRALADRQRTVLEEWAEVLAPLGLPRTMRAEAVRAWLGRLADVRRVAAEADDARAEQGALSSRRGEHVAALAEALVEAGREAVGARLAPALDLGAEVLEALQVRERRRQALGERVDEHRREVAQLERQVTRREQELDEWRERWGETVAAVGLAHDATVEEAADVLGHVEQLRAKLDAARQLRHRVDSIVEDGRRLDEDSRALAERHAPDLAAAEAGERIAQLVRRHRRMRHHQEELRAVERELEERQAELAEARREHADAEAVLGEAMRSAGAETVEELVAAEERASRARELERQIAGLEADLAEHGGGATVEELRERTAQEIERLRGLLDAAPGERLADKTAEDLVRIRLRYIEDDLEEAHEELKAAIQEVKSLEDGLRLQRGRSAASAAEEAQAHLASIREHAHRYARARLAAAILRREVERYRERNQDPILKRAGEIFPRLTLGELTGLRVGFDAADEPVLECVRADGSLVGVDGLSRGTRDQLYLALRVGSLERHAEQSGPLPVVLDDVLIHFDEPRTRAALEVLGELAEHAQVLLFTHHAHVLELAREAVPGAILREHDLDRLRSRPEPTARPRA